MIYLASPYTDKDQRKQDLRYQLACIAAAKLMQQGHVVFSPIAHSHGIAKYIDNHDHDFWMDQDLPLLTHADKMVVLMLPGWSESNGLKCEIEYAKTKGIPVEYMEAP